MTASEGENTPKVLPPVGEEMTEFVQNLIFLVKNSDHVIITCPLNEMGDRDGNVIKFESCETPSGAGRCGLRVRFEQATDEVRARHVTHAVKTLANYVRRRDQERAVARASGIEVP